MNKLLLTQIIKELKDICDSELINIDPNRILEESVKIYNTEIIQGNKGFKPANQFDNQDTKPTSKQIEILNKNKVKVPETRIEASFLIKEIFSKQKEK